MQYTVFGNHKWLSLILKCRPAYGHMSEQPESVEFHKRVQITTLCHQANFRGLLLQYIEDQKHQFPANLLYSTHLYSSDFLQGQYTFRVCKPDKKL